MKRALWAVGSVAVLAIALLVVSKVVVRPKACALVGALPTTTFVGEVVAKDGNAITYRVDAAVDAPSPVAPDPSAEVLDVGQEVEVTYWAGGERFVHRGETYLVPAYGQVPDALISGVHQPGDCPEVSPPPGNGSGPGTAHANGSAINTGLLAGERVKPFLLPVGLAVAVLGALAGFLIARRRTRTLNGGSREIEPAGPTS